MKRHRPRSYAQEQAYRAGYRSGFFNVGRSPSWAQHEEWAHAWLAFKAGWVASQKYNSVEPDYLSAN
jgi:hypothetical protein